MFQEFQSDFLVYKTLGIGLGVRSDSFECDRNSDFKSNWLRLLKCLSYALHCKYMQIYKKSVNRRRRKNLKNIYTIFAKDR